MDSLPSPDGRTENTADPTTGTKRCHCGVEFAPRSIQQLYCSPKCRPSLVSKRVTKECEHCGKRFKGRSTQVVCSRVCRQKRKYTMAAYKYTPVLLVDTQCRVCGKVFQADKRQAYCGDVCRETGYGRRNHHRNHKTPTTEKKP